MKFYLGGCACGAVRYQIDDEPVFENHASAVTASAGAERGTALPHLSDRAKAVVTGKVTTWHVAGDSGNEKIHAFCPTCGTPVHLTFAAMPDLLETVHAASLDSPELFHPSVVTYHARALDWDAVDPGLTKVQKMPYWACGHLWFGQDASDFGRGGYSRRQAALRLVPRTQALRLATTRDALIGLQSAALLRGEVKMAFARRVSLADTDVSAAQRSSHGAIFDPILLQTISVHTP